MADARGARVADLRRLLTLTQLELAAKADLPQSTVSAVERGRQQLTDGMAYRIARATGTPVEFFDFAAPAYDGDAMHFRKRRRVGARGREFVIQAFKEIERIARHLEDAPIRLRRTELPVAEESDIVSDRDIEEVALEVRRASGIQDTEPIRNVSRTMERAGIGIASLSVPHGNDNEDLLQGHCGMSRWDACAGRPTVAYIAGMSGDRMRFTLAHELAHTVLHTRRTVEDQEQREREADLFAGAYLVPKCVAEKSISETLTLHGFMRIKAAYGISIQALIMRGRKAGLISQRRQRSLLIQVSSRGWRTNEPVQVKCETPMLLWTQLSALHGSNPYFPASTAYGIAPTLLQQWVPRRARSKATDPPPPAPISSLDARRSR